MKRILTLATVFSLPGLAFAHEFKANELEIIHPIAFETAPTAKAGGGYFTIVNFGETDDSLIAVKADFPKVMVHKSEETDGIARMMHVDRVEIPAGETVEFAPGGYHVMFMGLPGPLQAGDSFPATLVFETAGELEIIFNVEERGSSKDDTDHSGHN